MIRSCREDEFEAIWEIINDGAQSYKGVIPADCWTEPYMSSVELRHEMDEGVRFWGYEDGGRLVAVMGLQEVQDVTLIRHAYVRTGQQSAGIGGRLLAFLHEKARRPVLIGTWAASVRAIRFYERHGFEVVSTERKERLLRRYWKVPERQIETSVVLVESPVDPERQGNERA